MCICLCSELMVLCVSQVLHLRGGGDEGEEHTCVAKLLTGERKGETCNRIAKGEVNSKYFCGYHLEAAKKKCVAKLSSGERKGETCNMIAKGELNGKYLCGYHLKAAKKEFANNVAKVEKLMEKLAVTRANVLNTWSNAGSSSHGIVVGTPVVNEDDLHSNSDDTDSD